MIDDPFGEDTIPKWDGEAQDFEDRGIVGVKKLPQSTQNMLLGKVKALLETGKVPEHILPFSGGLYAKVETRITTPDGASFTKDLLGLWDIAGWKQGFTGINVQVTSKAKMNDHLSSYTSHRTTTGADQVPVEIYARQFLREGGIFLLAGYWQVKKGSAWQFEWWIVTEAMLDISKARKRGPRKNN